MFVDQGLHLNVHFIPVKQDNMTNANLFTYPKHSSVTIKVLKLR